MSVLLLCCLAMLTSGCAVPYVTSVRGPIQSIRVLDAESGEDVSDATVALASQTSVRFLGPPPSSLTCPDLVEIRATSRGKLKRNDDLSYRAPSGLGLGSRGFFTGRPEDPNEYPRGVISVNAEGYRPALLRYTVGKINPGWSCEESFDDPSEGQGDPSQGGRCEFGDDGILRFYLRPLETASR